jgi:hypothetical protein
MLETILTFLQANWTVVLSIIFAIVFIGVLIFLWKIGKKQVVINIINGLIAKAEKEFGSGTGPIKLATVWAGIYKEIPWYIRMFFPKEEIEEYIKNGLEWLDDLLETQGINLLSYSEEQGLNVKE